MRKEGRGVEGRPRFSKGLEKFPFLETPIRPQLLLTISTNHTSDQIRTKEITTEN